MAIWVVTNLWKMTGSDEPGTQVHIKHLAANLTVSRLRRDLPETDKINNMSEADFNEVCRVSFFSTFDRPSVI